MAHVMRIYRRYVCQQGAIEIACATQNHWPTDYRYSTSSNSKWKNEIQNGAQKCARRKTTTTTTVAFANAKGSKNRNKRTNAVYCDVLGSQYDRECVQRSHYLHKGKSRQKAIYSKQSAGKRSIQNMYACIAKSKQKAFERKLLMGRFGSTRYQ